MDAGRKKHRRFEERRGDPHCRGQARQGEPQTGPCPARHAAPPPRAAAKPAADEVSRTRDWHVRLQSPQLT
eukprot:9347342-Alexandrium_andersonii.AAC.1